MGNYLNKGNENFRSARASEYVDKSGLIAEFNATLNSEQRYYCVTRCRRFGKSMAANMLVAYYDKSCDSHELFDDLSIAKDSSYKEHLNKYLVLKLDITNFTTRYRDDANIVDILQKAIQNDVLEAISGIAHREDDDLMETLIKANQITNEKFIFIIDEWDAILREYDDNEEVVTSFVNLLRRLFKGDASAQVFAGVYMTGILPIVKYQTESALNNFDEYSVVNPMMLDKYFGFTKEETKKLAEKYNMDYNDLENWYDGYKIGNEPSMFNPSSVIKALRGRFCTSYWGKTGAFDNVTKYIQMNYEGLKDDVISMLAGERIAVDTTKFKNDMHEVHSRDDVFTVLIHLGYLGYDKATELCYIPNKEVGIEMKNAVSSTSWTNVVRTLDASRKLLSDTLAMREASVATALERVHDEETSILSYNDEESLSCAISIAYYYAKNDYIVHREYATGKGFADIVFIPRKNIESPAIVVELKYNHSVDTAIDQIKQKNYPAKIAEYTGDILLVGISYDKETKTHSCKIEKISK